MKADKTSVKRLLNTAKGQIEGVLKMIDEDKYCIDISNQVMAAVAILKKVNMDIIDAHLHSCVKEAIRSGDEEKMDEISAVLKKVMK